jgi:hypothetical protein
MLKMTQQVGGCAVTVQPPSGAVTLVGDAGDHWTITNIFGFTSCNFTGTCNPRTGTCTNCAGVDAPVVCTGNATMMGTPSCTNNRPSCSLGTNGSATAFAHVQCVR